MTGGLGPSEEFLILFNRLKEAAGHRSERVVVFFHQSQEIRDALAALHAFLVRSDLNARLSRTKVVRVRAATFPTAWKEYNENWQFRVEPESWAIDLDRSVTLEKQYQEWYERATIERIEQRPTPSDEAVTSDVAELDPSELDDWLDHLLGDRNAAADAYIALEEYERLGCLVYSTRLDTHGVSRRWDKISPIFVPPHVSNRYGASDKGSLPNLLEDAARAFAFGAPAAAIAMCRAALEMVLKEFYRPDQKNNSDLSNLIVLAERQHPFVQAGKIDPIRKRANSILHRYHEVARLSEKDEQTILTFLKTLNFLIQRAPQR